MRSFHSINILEDNENENRVREVIDVFKSGKLKNIKTKKKKCDRK